MRYWKKYLLVIILLIIFISSYWGIRLFFECNNPHNLNCSSWVDPNKSEPNGTHYETFYSNNAKNPVSFLIYLPSSYTTSPAEHYPVIYWLYGSGEGQTTGAGMFLPRMIRLMNEHKIPQTIIVFPNMLNDSFFVDSYDGRWLIESMLVKNLVPYIDKIYRTIPDRKYRAIDGFSMGGYGAAHIGFKYPKTFGVVSIFSGPIQQYTDFTCRACSQAKHEMFGDNKTYYDENNPITLLTNNQNVIRKQQIIQLGYGSNEKNYIGDAMKNLAHVLDSLHIQYTLTVTENGGHGSYLTSPDEKPFIFYTSAFSH